MSYVKLIKTVQDHAVGFQSVNQAIDNNQALVDAFNLRHAIGVGGNAPFRRPLASVGRHDDILIARSVADFTVDTTLSVPALTAVIAGPLFGTTDYARISAGQWKIPLATPQFFGAVALMKSTASTDVKATCYASYDPSRGASVYVSTWIIDTGAWVTDDLPFSLVVWAAQS